MVGAVRLELVQGSGARRAPSPDPGDVSPLPDSPPTRVRIVDGALACIARTGVAGTTLDDVARQAGCSRATVYRAFPGGKDALLRAVVDTEVSRFFSALAVRMGEAADIEDVLVAGMCEAAVRVTQHPALGQLLANEPETVLSQLAFTPMDEALALTCAFTAPFLGRFLDPAESRRVAEWAARIVVSYLACPAEGMDLCDPAQVRRLVRLFVLPGIRALAPSRAAPPGSEPAARRRPVRPIASDQYQPIKGEVS
ncbi:MAG: helix-turn-helix domain-containing protein [Acidimicrobiales bacterium]|jgi:AcrR family transcriptional regulator